MLQDDHQPQLAWDASAIELLRGIPEIDVHRPLARGGMGLVYTAYHHRLQRLVALKTARPHKYSAKSHMSSLVHEAQMMAHLDHPHITKVYDFGHQEEIVWLTMELIEGCSLRHLIRTHRMSQYLAMLLTRQLAEALEHAHSRGIVHRDFKPENVLIDQDNNSKIIDFGLAQMRGCSYTVARPGRVAGTRHYMAPEMRGPPRDIDHRCDIYSLGVVMFEMFTGRPASEATPFFVSSSIGEQMTEVIQGCLSSLPRQRWDSVTALLSAMDRVLGEDHRSASGFSLTRPMSVREALSGESTQCTDIHISTDH